jgi:hypothetical protein
MSGNPGNELGQTSGVAAAPARQEDPLHLLMLIGQLFFFGGLMIVSLGVLIIGATKFLGVFPGWWKVWGLLILISIMGNLLRVIRRKSATG